MTVIWTFLCIRLLWPKLMIRMSFIRTLTVSTRTFSLCVLPSSFGYYNRSVRCCARLIKYNFHFLQRGKPVVTTIKSCNSHTIQLALHWRWVVTSKKICSLSWILPILVLDSWTVFHRAKHYQVNNSIINIVWQFFLNDNRFCSGTMQCVPILLSRRILSKL